MKKEIIEKYISLSESNDHEFHRFKSWNHCYKAFGNKNLDNDHLALHLAAYLASWGMYRGSTFLLEFDYKVNVGVVKIILEYKDILRNLKIDEFEKNTDQIFNLHNKICSYYNSTLKFYFKNGKKKKVKASDVLSTKIMLGTLGCIPAYDQFLKKGLEKEKLCQSFSKNNLFYDLINFSKRNKVLIENMATKYNCPAMKLLDMYCQQ